MTGMHGGDIAIVGAAETTRIGLLPEYSYLDLHAEAAFNAVSDAGIRWDEVDGLACGNMSPIEVAHHLGITPAWVDGTNVGGGTYMVLVRHAAAAIAAGAATTVLITHGESGRSRVGGPAYGMAPDSLMGQFEVPYGMLAPYSTFTLPARRFLHERGLSDADLAEVVVAQRAWASGNPRALKNEATTVDEVLAGPMIADPFRKDMCCVVTDGGAALILTTADRAKDLARHDRPVYLLGSGEAVETLLVSQMADLDTFGAFRRASRDAFTSSGLSPADIDHLMIYDAFAHLPLYGLEDLGFVERGDSARFIAEGNTLPGARLPLNTNGGGMSYTHTGMYGMFAILESVRQLRGEAFRQVDDVHRSFVQGVGLFFGSAGSLALANER